MLVSTPDIPAMMTLSITRSSRNPPKPLACQNTILETRYSIQQNTMVRRYPILSATTPQGISSKRHKSREMLSIRVISKTETPCACRYKVATGP